MNTGDRKSSDTILRGLRGLAATLVYVAGVAFYFWPPPSAFQPLGDGDDRTWSAFVAFLANWSAAYLAAITILGIWWWPETLGLGIRKLLTPAIEALARRLNFKIVETNRAHEREAGGPRNDVSTATADTVIDATAAGQPKTDQTAQSGDTPTARTRSVNIAPRAMIFVALSLIGFLSIAAFFIQRHLSNEPVEPRPDSQQIETPPAQAGEAPQKYYQLQAGDRDGPEAAIVRNLREPQMAQKCRAALRASEYNQAKFDNPGERRLPIGTPIELPLECEQMAK